jgi:hypothetical protein
LVVTYQILVGGNYIVGTNPVAKHLNKFNKPKRIEDKRYKKELKRMMKELKEQQEAYRKQYE